jgi:cytochrome c553
MQAPPKTFERLLVACVLAGATPAWCQVAIAFDPAATGDEEFFERRVRPILAEHCWSCHGAKKQEGGLRLDSRQGLVQGGDGGPVVDLAEVPASRMLKAIRRDGADLEMPPPPAARLPDAVIADLSQWLAAGAPWPASQSVSTPAPTPHAQQHWAFELPRSHEPPAVKNLSWPSTRIDRFVLASLEAAGIAPAPPADRRTLIRRVSYDLTGLPPSDEEVDQFLADPDASALAKVVDRLLDSPRYGERWGRHWLDVARYADTKGYVRLAEERRFHHAYSYRDWVIRAFNEDLPYNEFIERQLAADLSPGAEDPGALAALGFLTLGRQFTGDRYDILDDRIDVVGRGLLGLTLSCARCHDHKYDPIPTADYYSLFGIFASSAEPIIPPAVGTIRSDSASEAFQTELERRRRALDDYEIPQYAALLNEFRRRSGDYLVAALAGFVPLQQPLPKTHDEIRQVVVNRWIEYLARAGRDDAVFGPWQSLSALKPDQFATGAAELIEAWKTAGANGNSRFNSRVLDGLAASPPRSMTDVARAYGEVLAAAHQRWQDLTAANVAAASGALEHLADPAEEQLRRVLYAVDSPVAVIRQEALADYLYDAPVNDQIYKLRNEINSHLADTEHGPPRAHTLVETGVGNEPRILIRGNPGRPGRGVARHFLTVLSRDGSGAPSTPPPYAAATARLELARAIASRDNPLVARVLVNRVWAQHFGGGLVRTPSNFGLRGQAPTHPELLDDLAVRFMDEGWSIKRLHRWIMLSSTYAQSTHGSPESARRDPENRLVGRMARRRLDFEALRDSLLLAAGQLDLASGGPSVSLSESANRRRTVYALVDRQALPGVLPTFDFASPDTHSPERHATTVPQQALFLLNGPLAVSLARSFAARADVRSLVEPTARVDRMIRIAWGRPASEREIALALEFLNRDDTPTTASDALTSWQSLAQALLLSNEFMYVE